MPSLIVPTMGFALESSLGSPSRAGSGGADAFGLSLTDGMIEEMIRCVQNGEPIQLSLGEHPSFSYGTKTQQLSPSHDPFTYDVYQSTNSSQSDSSDSEMSSSGNSGKPVLVSSITARSIFIPKSSAIKPTYRIHKPSTITASASQSDDPAIAALQNMNAAAEAKKQGNTVVYIKDGSLPMPGSVRKGNAPVKPTNKAKFLSQHNRSLGSDTTRSMPSSPSLNAAGSPSLGPTSMPASATQSEIARAARKPVVHLLAVEPMTESTLKDKLPKMNKVDFSQAIQKVGDLNDDTGKYELRKNFYKELDVWNYDYSSSDRQRAIDNAVKQYDKMRMGISEPEWDRLLVKSERGTGKCLSKLQASIASGTATGAARAPKIKVQNADGSGNSSGDDDLVGNKTAASKLKGESAGRSSSQPPTNKPKKISEKEAQAKRLLSKNPGKAAMKAAPKAAPKATPKATPKAASIKKSAPVSKAGPKVLSSEFVKDSDEDEEVSASQPKLKPLPKPKAKPVVKRARDDDEVDTSDSSVPLSKKPKKDIPVANHRVSDASQNSRTTGSSAASIQSGYSSNKKTTSPQKSSPLASSPPTNVSEFGNSSGDRTSSSASPAHRSTKNIRSPIHKRHQKSASVASSVSSTSSIRYIKPEVTDLARKFKMYYPKYEALYKDILAMRAKSHFDSAKEKDLLDMHARLEGMKKSIVAASLDSDSSQ